MWEIRNQLVRVYRARAAKAQAFRKRTTAPWQALDLEFEFEDDDDGT